MSVLAAWAVYQDGAVMIALLRDLVRGPCVALLAGEGHFVRRRVSPSILTLGSLLGRCLLASSGEARVVLSRYRSDPERRQR